MKFVYELFGYIGAILLCIALFPQLIQIIKTKDAKSLSMIYLFILEFISTSFIIYTIGLYYDTNLKTILPMLIANIFQIIMTFVIIFLKIKYDKLTLVT